MHYENFHISHFVKNFAEKKVHFQKLLNLISLKISGGSHAGYEYDRSEWFIYRGYSGVLVTGYTNKDKMDSLVTNLIKTTKNYEMSALAKGLK